MYDRDRLATLSAVVEEGSFEAAAERLAITPSAVSQRIKALERQSRQILVRRSRPCAATEAGRTLLRLARQIALLEGEVARDLGEQDPAGTVHLPIAVNADSVTHWFLRAVVPLAQRHGVRLDLHIDDEEHTAALLREGAVVGAVTTSAAAVQGCAVQPIGATRYRPVAARPVYDRWFAGRDPAEAFTRAPRVDFGTKDRLQTRFAAQLTHRPCTGPAHRVPAADGYHDAVRAGLGWGMFTDVPARASADRGRIVLLDAERYLDVPLYWQHWKLNTTVLDALTAAVREVAAGILVPPPQR
ncbi:MULTISPECIES: LysR family transcriptional regulator ArgP [Pseudonocardia]|uniref:HTH-type transcriptional regulator n=2 Tax=Pseudonocardia TaxID=1847 RepID=A0ABQ0RQQ7_9PSEU|nr:MULTISPECIES: LysR family transcriptional regulator ArgP [Pseudonocardia]OSY41777.1 putative HTH-type transcriptional regulator [Pseudonocardia autotrophica]TDN71171.1 LysR family transcriptional regulator [Pseudonocardia autotrophica]BBG01841.1 putative HTH-type transcriptional regulator [Pseudonocardia autotrophica]GEC23007.1 putative HTH-type transcriptional regulator [Pseudonocardia saturnea]